MYLFFKFSKFKKAFNERLAFNFFHSVVFMITFRKCPGCCASIAYCVMPFLIFNPCFVEAEEPISFKMIHKCSGGFGVSREISLNNDDFILLVVNIVDGEIKSIPEINSSSIENLLLSQSVSSVNQLFPAKIREQSSETGPAKSCNNCRDCPDNGDILSSQDSPPPF